MISKKVLQILCYILATIIIGSSAGCGGAPVRGGSSVYYDMHYRNPWYGHPGAFPPPRYIGPPPVIIPPDIPEIPEIPDLPPLEAVPLPM